MDAPSSAAASAGATVAKNTALPGVSVAVPGGPELVERSAFLYGLLHSDHLVYDVHDAIAAVAAAAADTARDDGEVSGCVDHRRQRDHIGGGAVLTGVFYFPSRPPWPDMPWRPTYKSAVLLCVFVSPAACQRAIARLSEVAVSIRCGAGSGALQPLPMSSPSSSAVPTGTYSAKVVLRPASEYVLSPENVDAALLTFLTARQLAGLLLRRRRMQAPLDCGAATGASSHSSGDQVEDMLAFVRANPLSPRVSSSAARLFAAILSPQSTYSVDWVAAQVAVNRGDGVVVPEMKVVEPWVCGWGYGDRSEGQRKHEGRGRSEAGASGRETDDHRSDTVRHLEARPSWDTQTNSLPLTLQEEHYLRRYGATPQSRRGSGGGGGGGSNYPDAVDGHGGLMPTRGSLYRGVHHLFRGASWVLGCVRDKLGEKEAPLVGGSGGLYVPPPLSKSAPSPASSRAGAAAFQRERVSDEPPLRRTRTEETARNNAEESRCSAAMVIPRYNALGTALSWVPGFEHFGRLFVTSTTVLTPQGAATTQEPGRRSLRRRGREEEDAAEHPENSAWESLVMRRYADASTAVSQLPSQTAPVQDSVLSWMSPGRGTGWSVSSWPPQEKLQTLEATAGSAEGRVTLSSWQAARAAAAPSAHWAGTADRNGLHSLAASTIAANASSVSHPDREVAVVPPPALGALRSREKASADEPGSRRVEGAMRRHAIRIERVNSTCEGTSLQHAGDDSDDSTFLFHYRRRHQQPRSEPDRAASAVPAASASQSAPQAAPPRRSFAETLRKATMDAREDVAATRAPHTPVGGSKKGANSAGGGVERPSLDSELSQRSSRRTVSFTLPDSKS